MLPTLAAVDWAKVTQVLAWPIVVLIGLVFLFTSRTGVRLLNRLPGRLTGFKAFGLELELSTEGATKIRSDVEEAFADYRNKANREFDRLTHVNLINDLRRTLVEQHVLPRLTSDVKSTFRCTIHVQDILFDEAMYQLLDYYPKGGGGGRAFSMRFGLVGRAWRLGESQLQSSVDPEPTALIEKWGMTSQEAAAAGQGRKSFACLLLRDDRGIPAGILYFDAQQENAFGSTDEERTEFRKCVEEEAGKIGLTGSVANVCKGMRERGPVIRIFRRDG
jgi:hypothetical protein